jgi:hypothetical protein
MKVDHKIKLSFYHIDCDLYETLFVTCFLSLGMHIFLFSFIVVCIHLMCYTINYAHFIMCALCEKKQSKKLVDQKKKNVLFSSMFFFYINIITKLVSYVI